LTHGKQAKEFKPPKSPKKEPVLQPPKEVTPEDWQKEILKRQE